MTITRTAPDEYTVRVGRPRTNPTHCTYVEPDGTECGGKCASKGLCAKHYAQKVRGRLGKTRPRAEAGEAGEVKAYVGADLKARLERRAAKEKISVSQLCAGLLYVAIHKPRGFAD